jgi:hypothetical protein
MHPPDEPGINPLPIEWKAGWAERQSVCSGEKKVLLISQKLELPIIQHVAWSYTD